MYGYAIIEILSLLLVGRIVASDRLDNAPQVPVSYSTSSQGGGRSFPHQSDGVGDYRNLYKGSPDIYAASSNPILLHKAHYSPPRVAGSNAESPRDNVPIVKQTFEPNSGDGAYSFSYETGNGITASEYGTYTAGSTGEEGIQSASGSYSYTGPDSIVYTITYTAGVEGFVPQGAHLPTPPPVPESIQKILHSTTGSGGDFGTYPNEPSYSAGKYQPVTSEPSKFASYAANAGKYQSNDGTAAASNKYTAAVQIPYTGYKRAKSESLNEYKVHDEFSN